MQHAESYRRVSEEYALAREKWFLFSELINKGVANNDYANWLIYGDSDLEKRLSFLEDIWSKRAQLFKQIDFDSVKDLTEMTAALGEMLVLNKVLIFLSKQLLAQKSSGGRGNV